LTKAFTTIRSTDEGVSDQPRRARARRDRRPGRLREGARPGDGRARLVHRPEDRPKAREGDLQARGDFKGKYAETAPDILLEPAEQYSLTHAKTALEDADWISGDHRIEGVIVAAGRT
jgi:hypothetical protein